jgi:hypothetical protein
VSGDVRADIITVPGPGFPSHVRVFDGQIPQSGLGTDLAQSQGLRIGSFIAFEGFTGGAYVAAGDVDGDNRADVIIGAGPGAGPHVQVFGSANAGAFVLQSFYAYAAGFSGGVRVAASEFSLDGRVEIVTSPGPGGGPHVRLFDGQQSVPNVSNLFAFGEFTGGVFVAGSSDYTSPVLAQSLAAGFEAINPSTISLTLTDVESLKAAAIVRLAEAGLSHEQAAQLQAVQFSLGDLPSGQLGLALDGTILLDLTAAGLGWYIDPTPLEDEDFAPAPNGSLAAITRPAIAGVDLLSVILHEFAHQLGGKDLDADLFPGHLLADAIAPGERRLPEWRSLDAVFAEDELFRDLLHSGELLNQST